MSPPYVLDSHESAKTLDRFILHMLNKSNVRPHAAIRRRFSLVSLQIFRRPSALACPHGLAFPGSGGYLSPQTMQIRLISPPVWLSDGFAGRGRSSKTRSDQKPGSKTYKNDQSPQESETSFVKSPIDGGRGTLRTWGKKAKSHRTLGKRKKALTR